MSDLVLNNIHKYYDDFHAVKGIDLHINPGEFAVLVGPSGCGKSTLLRSIAGLEDITEGSVTLGGTDLTGLAPGKRNLAMVFQSYALYPYLSVYENIAFGLRARKTPRAEVDRKVRDAADLLSLTDYLDRKPRALSGGQRQRVAIGRAIVRDAELFLFDEPLSNLDAKLRDEMREELKKLHARLGKTFIYVTHDQIEAMTLADRIVLMKDGEIEQQGPALSLFEAPDNLFVAGFLGSPAINRIPVTPGPDGASFILPDGQALELDKDMHARISQVSGDLIWGVRPEHLLVQSDSDNAIACTIDVLQPTGSRLYASFNIGPAHVTAELPAHAVGKPGDQMHLAPILRNTHFFDATSGKRIDWTET